MNFYLSKDRPDVHSKAIAYLSNLNTHEPWRVSIENKKPDSKTAQQRKYFHKLLSVFCKETGNDPKVIKISLKKAVLEPVKMKHKDPETGIIEDVLCVPSSEDINIREYGDLIQSAQMLCMSHGIEYPDPRDLGMKI